MASSEASPPGEVAPAASTEAAPAAAPSTAPEPALEAAPAPPARELFDAEEATWRFWPDAPRLRAALVAWGVVVTAYFVGIVITRYWGIWDPWTIDGDQPQAVFHYWRYHVAGAFPPGDLITDYAFVMHAPPVWWALMASLSTVVTPILAAKLLNLLACFGAGAVLFYGVSRRSNAFVGFGAAALLIRTVDFTAIIAGGYARSFGPMLTLAFLGAFMARKHTAALAILVLQAAFYPSVVIPCGIAYGIYTVIAGPMRDRVRRMATMFVAGLLIIAFGMFQDIAAPKWWGSVVTLEQALKMPAWGPGGRITEAPLRPMSNEVPKQLLRPVRDSGHIALSTLGHFVQGPSYVRPYALVGALMAFGGVLFMRRRRAGRRFVDPVPWQVPLLFAAAFAAYLLARVLAFKLYLPYRPLQHVVPYVFYAGLPLTLWALCVNLLPRRRTLAIGLSVGLTVAPMMILFGDGLDRGPGGYAPQRGYEKLFTFVRTLPVDAVLGGELALVDKTPLFSWHRAYVNRVLAHPFRPGYYAEAERRIIDMYTALYAPRLADVIAFGEKEKVDYLVYRTTMYTSLDRMLFNPPRRLLTPIYAANKKRGFPLAKPPAEAVVFRDGATVVISIAKLKEALAHMPPEQDVAPEPTPMIGPMIGPKLPPGFDKRFETPAPDAVPGTRAVEETGERDERADGDL